MARRPTATLRTRRRDRSRLRVGRVAALVLAAAATLPACGPDQIGTAAVIGGERISVADLQRDTRDFLAAAPGTDAAAGQGTMLQGLIVSQVIEAAAEDVGARVTDGQVAAERSRLLAPLRSQAGQEQVSARVLAVRQLAQQQTYLPPQELDRFVRDQLLFQAISEAAAQGAAPGSEEAAAATNEALVSASRGLSVDVNPRYGTWDPERGLARQVGGGLSKTVDELTGTKSEQR
ncbi:MAG: hypothetical protein ACRDV2_09115 [Actinomycetes bacterium]